MEEVNKFIKAMREEKKYWGAIVGMVQNKFSMSEKEAICCVAYAIKYNQ